MSRGRGEERRTREGKGRKRGGKKDVIVDLSKGRQSLRGRGTERYACVEREGKTMEKRRRDGEGRQRER